MEKPYMMGTLQLAHVQIFSQRHTSGLWGGGGGHLLCIYISFNAHTCMQTYFISFLSTSSHPVHNKALVFYSDNHTLWSAQRTLRDGDLWGGGGGGVKE